MHRCTVTPTKCSAVKTNNETNLSVTYQPRNVILRLSKSAGLVKLIGNIVYHDAAIILMVRFIGCAKIEADHVREFVHPIIDILTQAIDVLIHTGREDLSDPSCGRSNF